MIKVVTIPNVAVQLIASEIIAINNIILFRSNKNKMCSFVIFQTN